MSTWIYLQCDSHTPPILSDGEVGQHIYDLSDIRRHIKNRELYRFMAEKDLVLDTQGDHFAGNAFRFLITHPHCDVSICDEYGDTYPLEKVEPDEKE